MILQNKKNLGFVFVILGALAIVFTLGFVPIFKTITCNNSNCVTSAPSQIDYAVVALGSGAGILTLVGGLVLIYLAVRPRFDTMHP